MKPTLIAYLLLCLAAVACSLPQSAGPLSAPVTLESPAAPKAAFSSCQPANLPGKAAPPASFPTPTAFPSANPAPTLRGLADSRGLYIGAAVFPEGLSDPAYASLLSKEFNILTPENVMKWNLIHPEAERFDFAPADALVAFARANGMAVYGHTLVWDAALPEWMTAGSFSRDELMSLLCIHIKTVVSHFRGQVVAWDVLNEALDDQGRLRDTIFLRVIGPEYIAMSFQWAHEADPNAILVFNEAHAEGLNHKSQSVYALAQGLLELGVPIHAIGLQMHLIQDGPPTSEELAANIQRLSDLGLAVHITEMDVRLQYSAGTPADLLARQAQTYRQALEACLSVSGCRVFTAWGLTDRYSWIPGYTGSPDAPLLFNQEGQPKPAYYALLEALAQSSRAP